MHDKRILLSTPHMGGEEINQIQNAFDLNWIAPVGPHIKNFESKLSKIHHKKHVAALQSGTSAIHLALNLLGVSESDIVLCQSFTFVGSVNPIKYLNATPVFIDSEIQTWNICPDALEAAINKYIKKGKKPKAIIVVNLYGMPCKINDILQLSKIFDIPIIEDAAESLGSKIENTFCGSFGDFGILSFNGNKIITTSGGGAIISSNQRLIEKAKFLATQAKENCDHYEHREIGFNYRISNISAAIGIGQLKVLDKWIKLRRDNYNFYFSLLSSIDGISFQEEPNSFYSNRWLTTILIDESKFKNINSNVLRKKLEFNNIESRPLWKPMHLQPLYKDCDFIGSNVSDKIYKKGLCLPSGSNLSKKEKERIENVLSDFFNLK